MVEPKKNMRDSVFVNIFGDKRYLAELYLSLHPEDTISEDDLEIVRNDKIAAWTGLSVQEICNLAEK